MSDSSSLFDNEDRSVITNILNQMFGNDVSNFDILSYTEDSISNNNSGDIEAFLSDISDIYSPKNQNDWASLGIDTGLSLFDGASQDLSQTLSDPTISGALKNAAGFAARAQFASSLYFGVEAAKQEVLNNPGTDPNFETARQFAQIGSGVLGGTLAIAAAKSSLLSGFLAGVSLTNPLGLAAVGLAGGFVAAKTIDHYWDDIVGGNAEGVLGIADDIGGFLNTLEDTLDDVIGDILDAPDFFDDIPAFFDDLVDDYGFGNPSAVIAELPSWLQGPLGWIEDTPGLNLARSQTGGGMDPLVFDLNGDGVISLTSVDDSTVSFDYWNDGLAEVTGWVAPDDGMLAIDLDGNGVISGAEELFGSDFPLSLHATNSCTVTEDMSVIAA